MDMTIFVGIYSPLHVNDLLLFQ